METPTAIIDHRYGPPIHHNESDDDMEEKKDTNDINNVDDQNDNDDDEHDVVDKDFNSHALSEVELAATSRADLSIVRATDAVTITEPTTAITTTTTQQQHATKPLEALPSINNHANNRVNGQIVNSNLEEPNVEETLFEQTLNDANEFESLLFSVRRPSARSRLLKFIGTLKRLSSKLQWEEEVNDVLQKMKAGHDAITSTGKTLEENSTNSNDHNSNTTNGSQPPNKKRKRASQNEEKKSPTSSQTPIFAETALTNTSLLHITNAAKVKSTSKDVGKKISSIPSSNPPSLKDKDEWVKLHQIGSILLCPDFSVNNVCPLSCNCPRKHVYKPPANKPNCRPMTKELYYARRLKTASPVDMLGWYSKLDLERAYDQYRKTTLTKESFSDKIKPDDLNVSYYTSCFMCPVDKTIYYSQPFPGDLFVNGNKSSQGIWWYLNIKDARDAVVTHVIRHLQERKIIPFDFQPDLRTEEEMKAMKKMNAAKASAAIALSAFTPSKSSVVLSNTNSILSSILPNINPWNWAELEYESRCVHFNSPAGCAFGRNCPFAHVHYPKSVISDRFPPKEAVPTAYYQHFQVFITDSFFQPMHQRQASTVFHVKTVVDNRNQIWYTAAWKCPHEKIIYYGAGGISGRNNSQGFVLYPSIEEAKLAVCGVVLNALYARGFRGPWSSGYID